MGKAEPYLRELRKLIGDMERERRESVRIIRVNKRTHRLRFESETEEEVTIVIEPKEKGGKK